MVYKGELESWRLLPLAGRKFLDPPSTGTCQCLRRVKFSALHTDALFRCIISFFFSSLRD